MATAHPIPTNPRFKDLTGKPYGKLKVIEYRGKSGIHTLWACTCKCGSEIVARGTNLRSGNTASCGCVRNKKSGERNKTHGMRHTPEYEAWINMVNRCTRPTCKQYDDYGGRGICVCKEWLHSFDAFFAAVGKRPSKQHSLDRYPNVNGNYEPCNVRWATRRQQGLNRRDNRLVTHDGKTRTLTEWSEVTGVSVQLIWKRLSRGWNPERALGHSSNQTPPS